MFVGVSVRKYALVHSPGTTLLPRIIITGYCVKLHIPHRVHYLTIYPIVFLISSDHHTSRAYCWPSCLWLYRWRASCRRSSRHQSAHRVSSFCRTFHRSFCRRSCSIIGNSDNGRPAAGCPVMACCGSWSKIPLCLRMPDS